MSAVRVDLYLLFCYTEKGQQPRRLPGHILYKKEDLSWKKSGYLSGIW